MSIKIKNKIYKAIIFDVDDTLIDTSKSYDEAIKKTVNKFTLTEVSDKDLSLVRSKGITYGVNNDWNVTWLLMELVKHFSKEKWAEALKNNLLNEILSDSAEYLEMKAYFQSLYLGKPHFNGQGLINIAEKKMYDDNFFPKLKTRGVICAVVTSRPTDEALYALKNVHGLVGEFIESDEFIISAGSKNAVGKLIAEKPSPEPILECIHRLGVIASRCVYIGNSSSDYIAAREAKVDFIQVGISQIERDRSKEAKGFNYFRLNSVNELLDY